MRLYKRKDNENNGGGGKEANTEANFLKELRRSRSTLLENFSLKFSSSSFAIRINSVHSKPPLFLYGLLLPPLCFSFLQFTFLNG